MTVMSGGDDSPRALVVLVVGDAEVPLGTVERSARCDLELVDELLRVMLVAVRRGWAIRLSDVDDELRDLVALVGLSERFGL